MPQNNKPDFLFLGLAHGTQFWHSLQGFDIQHGNGVVIGIHLWNTLLKTHPTFSGTVSEVSHPRVLSQNLSMLAANAGYAADNLLLTPCATFLLILLLLIKFQNPKSEI